MALSGSYDYTETRNDIIKGALRKIGVVAQGDSPTPEQVAEAAQALNRMVKSWQAFGIHLWTTSMVQQTLTASSIVLGDDGNDYRCIVGHTSTAADEPITGANYSSRWKLLSTSTGAAWALATPYTSIGEYTLNSSIIDIHQAFIRSSSSDTDLAILSKEQYNSLSNKYDLGRPHSIYLKRNVTNTKVYLHPVPDDSTYVIHMDVVNLLQDVDASNNNLDFLVEWLDALVYGLAAKLSDEYGLALSERAYLDTKAEKMRKEAMEGTFRGDLQFSIYREGLR